MKFCLCMGYMCVCIQACEHVGIHTCRSRGWCWIASSIILHISSWDKLSHWNWSSLIWQAQLTRLRNPPVSTCPALVWPVYPTTSFCHRCWESELSSLCMCCTIFTDSAISSAFRICFDSHQHTFCIFSVCAWYVEDTMSFITFSSTKSLWKEQAMLNSNSQATRDSVVIWLL